MQFTNGKIQALTELGTYLVVNSALSMQGVCVRSLVGDLRSQMLVAQQKKKKKKTFQSLTALLTIPEVVILVGGVVEVMTSPGKLVLHWR